MDACRLTVRVSPRSSQNKIERSPDGVRIWVAAAPTDGQANEAVIRLLSAKLGLAPSKISLVRGASSREKTFEIDGLSADEALGRLD
jgi:uncharacterized protein YggU (UPF0235/DUF167 family)